MDIITKLAPYFLESAFFIAGCLAGGFISYKYRIGLTRRQEWNSAVKPIRELIFNDRQIEKETILKIQSEIGSRARIIVSVYGKEYYPSQQLTTVQRGFDEFGNPVEPIEQSTLDKNKQTQQRAKEKLLKACELKR